MTTTTKIIAIALAAATLLGCGQESRYQVTTKDGVTIKIDNATGKTYRLNGNSWVEIKEASPAQKRPDDVIRETYEKMTDEELAQELEKLKGEELVTTEDAALEYIRSKMKEELSDSVNAEKQIKLIKEIQRVRRVQKAAGE